MKTSSFPLQRFGRYLIGSIAILMFACSSSHTNQTSLNNVPFAFAVDKATSLKKGIVMLSGEVGTTSSLFLEADLSNDESYANKFYKENILVRIDGNAKGFEWLSQILDNKKTPIVLYFDKHLKLGGITEGPQTNTAILAAIDSVNAGHQFIRLTDNLLPGNNNVATQLSYVQQLLNIQKTWEARGVIDKWEQDTNYESSLLQSISKHSYFYNNYLMAKMFAARRDTVNMVRYANTALSFIDAHSVDLFAALRMEMKLLARPERNIDNAPYLAVGSTSVDLGTVKSGSYTKTSIIFNNTGAEALNISTITTGCSCTIAGFSKAPIPPGKTAKVDITYHATTPGTFSRAVIVYSNAINAKLEIMIKGVAI
ncbi:DUF1573 domain-containing protein [Chitinophaga sp. Hz27]|uniref:DUF1573 domain-containing protein n=1 Tax=Chitinophaga sp. Hz27 TaxID=3347169 RepID=UPI0035DDE8AA